MASFKKLMKKSFWVISSQIFSRGSILLSSILLARNFTVGEFANYNYFLMTVNFIASISAFGMGVTASRYFSELSFKPSKENSEIAGTIWMLSVLVTIISSISLIIYFSIYDLNYLNSGYIVFAVILMGLLIVPNGAIIGLELYRKMSVYYFINALILILFVIKSIEDKDINIAIYGFLISLFIQLILTTSTVLKTLKKSKNYIILFKKNHIKKVLNFSLPMLATSILVASSSWIVSSLVLKEMGEYQFAVYSIGLQWFSIVLFIPGVLSQVIMPRLVKEQDNLEEKKKTIRQMLAVNFSITLALLILGGVFSPLILEFYGHNYTDYWYIIPIFLLAAVMYCPANILGNSIVVRLGSMVWLKITFIWFLMFLLLSCVGCMYFDNIIWIVFFQTLSSLILFMISFFYVKRMGEI